MAPPGAAAEGGEGGPGLQALEDLLPSDDDLLYEEELLRNPYALRMWWRYLEARRDAPARRRYLLFERALKALPGSYKARRPAPRSRAPPAHGSPAVPARRLPSERRRGRLRRTAAEPGLPPGPRSCGTPTCASGRRPCAGCRSRTRPWRR